MPLITLLFWIVVIGVGVYLVNTYVPMPEWCRIIFTVVAVLAMITLLARAFGVSDFLFQPIPRIR